MFFVSLLTTIWESSLFLWFWLSSNAVWRKWSEKESQMGGTLKIGSPPSSPPGSRAAPPPLDVMRPFAQLISKPDTTAQSQLLILCPFIFAVFFFCQIKLIWSNQENKSGGSVQTVRGHKLPSTTSWPRVFPSPKKYCIHMHTWKIAWNWWQQSRGK